MMGDPSRREGDCAFGVIGLGVMGRNLALNVEEHGFGVAIWNRHLDKVEAFEAENRSKRFVSARTLQEFVAALARPRKVLLMVKAGPAVDAVIETLLPLLDPGDIIIDGGNSWFRDTQRREAALAGRGLGFLGVGVSGGEEGARHGPSLMPGGTASAWEAVREILEAIAARTTWGACVTYVGPGGAGHFVKTVHNGIEYADMQLIAEAYDLLGRGGGLEAGEIAKVFDLWNQGVLGSFLSELTARVLLVNDPVTGGPLVESVLDCAGQKGTGRWTVQVALEMGVPVPAIAAAVDGRVLSSMKAERQRAAEQLTGPEMPAPADGGGELITAVHDALYAAKICAYAQGLHLIRQASAEHDWKVDLREIARIWTGGCIIRARLLEDIMQAYVGDAALANLLLDPRLGGAVQDAQRGWRYAVRAAHESGIPVPALGASLNYFDSYRTARLPQNLTQAQRDAFGAHTYQRVDDPGGGFVHTDWLGEERHEN